MAPTCTNCSGTEFVWANEVKTGTAGGLSLRPKGEVPIGTRICKNCGHADLFLHDLELLKKPHLWKPGEFYPISGKSSSSSDAPSSTSSAPAPLPSTPLPPPTAPSPSPSSWPPPPQPPAPDAMPEPPAPEVEMAPPPAEESASSGTPTEPDPVGGSSKPKTTRRRTSKSKTDDA